MVVLIVLCFGVEFLCCLSLMYVFITLVEFGWLGSRLLGGGCSLECFRGIATSVSF